MRFAIIPFLFLIVFLIGCGSIANETNSNAALNQNQAGTNLNSNGWVKIEPTNGNAASIPNANSKTVTPTPGIPDPANANKVVKPGATPTPGIPDAANIKKQLEKNAALANAVMNANMPTAPPVMMNKKKRPGPIGNRQP